MVGKIKIDASFYIYLAVSLLIMPARWILAWMFASCVHELCHLFVLKIFRCRIYEFRISFGGAVIHSEALTTAVETICAISGPLGSFSLLLFTRCAPAVAICGCIQGLYNLLPLETMDGGRIIKNVMTKLIPGKSMCKFLRIVRCLIVWVLLLTGIYIYLLTGLLLPFIFSFVIVLKDLKKTLQKPCQTGTIMLPV